MYRRYAAQPGRGAVSGRLFVPRVGRGSPPRPSASEERRACPGQGAQVVVGQRSVL